MTVATLDGQCVLPGCKNPMPDFTMPCPECKAAFGDHLQPAKMVITNEAIAERDAATAEAYRKQHAVALGEDGDGIRKRNQLCWLCEERKTCQRIHTRAGMEWECDDCRALPT